MVILGKKDWVLGDMWALSNILYVYGSDYIKSQQLNGNKLLANILISLYIISSYKINFYSLFDSLFSSHAALSVRISGTN